MLGHRLGLRGVRPGARRLRPAAAVRDAPGGPRRPAGRARLGHHPARRTDPHRQHPRPGRRRLPVALARPRRRPRGVAGHGPRTARRRHAGGGEQGIQAAVARVSAAEPGARPVLVDAAHPRRVRDRHERQDHDHPAAGPHRDDRRPRHRVELHRRRPRPGRAAGGGRLLRTGRCPGGPGRSRGRSWASWRPPAGACCSRAWGSRPTTSASSPTCPRTTSGSRGSTPWTSWPRSRRSSPGSPSRPAGSSSTVTTRGSGRCAAEPGAGRGRSASTRTHPRCASRSTPAAAAATVLDGDLVVLSPGADPDHLVPVVDVPVTLSGLSVHNIANALAATAAALGLGLPRAAVVEGLRTFAPDPLHNPGRMNVYSVPARPRRDGHRHRRPGPQRGRAGGAAGGGRGPAPAGRRRPPRPGHRRRPHRRHPRGARRARRPARRPGDRGPQGALPARALDGTTSRTTCGSAWPGSGSARSTRTRPSWTACWPWSPRPSDGDVLAVMCHADRALLHDWLTTHGGTVDGADRPAAQGGRRPRASTRPRRPSPPCGPRRTPRCGCSRPRRGGRPTPRTPG